MRSGVIAQKLGMTRVYTDDAAGVIFELKEVEALRGFFIFGARRDEQSGEQ